MKKLYSILCMMVALTSFALALPEDFQDEFDQVVFDVRLVGGDEVFFGIVEDEVESVAVFYDGGKAELNILICDASENRRLRELGYECKLLTKSVVTKSDYERKNINGQIKGKIEAFAKFISDDFDTVEGLGFVKINTFMTSLCQENNASNHSSYMSSKNQVPKTKLSVWSFSDEVEGFLDQDNFGYKENHPDVEVEYSLIPVDAFESKLDSTLATGWAVPDVFSLDEAFVRKYVECGLLLPLDDLYEEVKEKMVDYPIKVGSYDGHVYAMSWQIAPGAVFYRRSLAKKYLGTDDPLEIQKKLCDFDTFIKTARELKDSSKGKCRIVASFEDLFLPYKASRKNPWIVDGKLLIDAAMDDYMETSKIFYDEELDGRCSQWSERWFDGMNGTIRDGDGNEMEIMCYFLPTWGLNYVLKLNAPETYCDWAMCEGPEPYRWGGAWLAAYKGTKHPEAVKEMIRYLTTDDAFLEELSKDSGEFVGNRNVQEKVGYRFDDPFLGGQNPYPIFCRIADSVNGSLEQRTDSQVEMYFTGAVSDYAYGIYTKEEALDEFKACVSRALDK